MRDLGGPQNAYGMEIAFENATRKSQVPLKGPRGKRVFSEVFGGSAVGLRI